LSKTGLGKTFCPDYLSIEPAVRLYAQVSVFVQTLAKLWEIGMGVIRSRYCGYKRSYCSLLLPEITASLLLSSSRNYRLAISTFPVSFLHI